MELKDYDECKVCLYSLFPLKQELRHDIPIYLELLWDKCFEWWADNALWRFWIGGERDLYL